MDKAVRILLLILFFSFLQGAELWAVLLDERGPEAMGPHPAATRGTTLQDLADRVELAPLSNQPVQGFVPMVMTASGDPEKAQDENAPEGVEEGDSLEGSSLESGGLEGDLEDGLMEDAEDGFEEEFGESMADEISDPFSGYNRFMTAFNDGFYVWVFDPVARGYRFVMPEFGRRGIANFFHNILFPLRFINNLLQVKFANAGEEFLRFCINTTIGLLGFFDPAEAWFGLEVHEEDFGQTMGVWGVGAGPHIVLPFLGPSNLRDMFSLVPDYYLDPKRFVDPAEAELAVRVFEEINDISLHIGEYDDLKKDALDLYPFLRDVYEQNRQQKILE